jgi:hypothetical protein
MAVEPQVTETYARLAAPFEVTFTDIRGGVELTYVSGEQVVRRLNEVLGVGGWSFRVLGHDINPEADEAWALGELVAEIGDRTVVRQQFGSQKLKRSRSTGVPLDIGFDLKGAATDAMKKCASLLGVGLYLSRKEARAEVEPAICEACGQRLKDTRFKDGTAWTADQLSTTSKRKHGRVLCFKHYCEANEQRRPRVVERVSA